MNVSTPLTGTTAPAHRGHRRSEATTAAVAKELGMSTADLRSALASGQSMTDLARKAGVSKDDLVSTIASTLPPKAGADATRLATRIADHVRPTDAARPPSAASAAPVQDGSGRVDVWA